jgi:hypothetical protein
MFLLRFNALDKKQGDVLQTAKQDAATLVPRISLGHTTE